MASSVSDSDPSTSSDSIPKARTERRGWRFWIIFVALCVSLFLTALDLASVSTALPSIIHDLDGTDSFVWVSSAYTLACTAVLPMSGRLADIFGRQYVLLIAILFFGVGSAVAGAATSMDILIAGRTIQGVGSGAIQVLVAIVIADLIPLKDRGFFQALTGATYSFASAIGPSIGGAIAQHASWRWLFYLNLPLCAIAFTIVLLFLHLRKPPVQSFTSAFMAMDWIGNIIIIGSATSCIFALTNAGVKYSWSSVEVIVPLTIGLVGFPVALLYDAYIASHPVVPIAVINNRTSISGYITTFFHGLVVNSVVFYLPAYFQSCKVAPPLLSGLYFFPTALFISPSAVVQGIIVSKTGRYRLVTVVGWAAMLVGVGLFTLIDADTPIAVTVPMQIIASIGFGFLWATNFTVMAPLDPVHNASALSFLLFVRTFSSAWAVAISGTILQNQLDAHLPPAFLATFPPRSDLAYSVIPAIAALPPSLQTAVRAAFAAGFRLMWRVLLGFCGAGLLSVALQKHVVLHEKMDERWGMIEREEAVEAGMEMKHKPAAEEVCGEKAEDVRVSVCEVDRSQEAVDIIPVLVVSPPESEMSEARV
ncbi:hypothetical protein VTO73DRAFT_15482 [Trametes versicolor]